MPRPLRRLVAPLVDGLTYRRYVHLLLGAVILLPYLGLVALIVATVNEGGLDLLGLLLIIVPATGIAFGVTLVPGVRALSITAARALLGADVPEPDPATIDDWPGRRRAAAWLLLNVAVGALAALATLIVVPTTLGFLFAPWLVLQPFPTGRRAWWLPLVGAMLPVVLVHACSAAGAVLARLAPRVLGPTPTERMAAELAEAHAAERALAERNRLARELHDSVGHALTVTTLQAGAAARVLDTDPAFAAKALDAIAEAGRAALADLDHVLGLLRDGGAGDSSDDAERLPHADRVPPAGSPSHISTAQLPAGRTGEPPEYVQYEGRLAGTPSGNLDPPIYATDFRRGTLADLDALVSGARSAGVRVELRRDGATGVVPRAVSREAYRIVQEGLTNALRHAGPVPVAVRVAVRPDAVELELTNPLGRGPSRRGGGRGLAGMRERVGVLRGELTAGPDGDRWRVAARLPLGSPDRMDQ